MTIVFIAIPTICYSGLSVSCLLQRDTPHAMMYGGYSFANVGLMIYEWSKL